jgi:hypothetical protein
MLILASILALLIASLTTMAELVTTEYPRIFFAIRRCLALYLYSLIYGFGALVTMLIIPFDRFGLHNPLLEAIIVGVFIKAFLNINLISVPVPNSQETFPLGLQSIVRLFEPWFLDQIKLEASAGVNNFVKQRAEIYQDANVVRGKIFHHLPPNTNEDGFKLDLDLKLKDDDKYPASPDEKMIPAMRFYLLKIGKKNFDQVFPFPLERKVANVPPSVESL